MAERRSESEIKSLAQSVLQTQAAARGRSASTVDDLHIVEQLDGISIVAAGTSGFAVITNDDRQLPVVGYSFSTYDEGNVPGGFLWWKQAINEVLASGMPITRTSVPSQFKPTVEPLLKTTWDQYYPYNEKCPIVNGEHCVTGCVPTALAQVLYYYRYPLHGTGSHGGVDFSNIIFEWSNMLPEYSFGKTIQKEAVATLMYACGIATDVNYQTADQGGSSASLSTAATALKTYFGYDSPQFLIRDSYSGDWMGIIYGELSKDSPVIYAGQPKDFCNSGHAFILDGYDADGNMHINWGWGGAYDGYYNIDDLKPGGSNYTISQTMIYNIRDYVEQPMLSTIDHYISGTRQAGAEHTFHATVTNYGSNFNGTLHLFVSQDNQGRGSLAAQQNVSIASSTEATVTLSYTPATDGHYCLRLTADSEGYDVVGKTYLDIGPDEAIIAFSDKNVEKYCLNLFDLSGDNGLSFKEAAAVKTLEWSHPLYQAEIINLLCHATSFDELKYFTSLTTIPAELFIYFDDKLTGYTSNLKSISLPPSVQTLEEGAFVACRSLEKVTFSDNTQLEEIPALAFSACEKLNDIVLPASVKTLGDHAFYHCKSLESIVMPQSLVSIGENAFSGCTNLKEITLPDAVESIGAKAFYECESLKDVILNEGLKSIGDQAFYSCSALNTIVIPTSLEQMGSKVFWTGYYLNKDLQHVYVKWTENPFVGKGDEFDIYWSSETRLHVPLGTKALYESLLPWKNFNIIVEEIGPSDDPNIINFEDGVVRELCIGAWDSNGDNYLSKEEAAAVTDLGTVFKGNDKIKTFDELKYFTGLTSIASKAFNNCKSMKAVTLPNTVTTIESSAFRGCRDLETINIPTAVTTIGDWAFDQCYDLSTLTIGNSMTNIGKGAFNSCSGLISIVVESGNPVFDSRENCNAIIETANNTLIVGCKNTVIPNDVTSIGENAFNGCSDLTTLTIPNSVTSIGENAFYGCSNLTTLSIPNSVTSIGGKAFYDCWGLNSIVVESGNTAFDSRENCNAIIETASNTLIVGCKNTVIPNGVTSIGDNAFYGCSDLTTLTIPNSVKSIGFSAFCGCSGMTTLTIPNSVTSIGANAFCACRNLTTLTIPNSVTSIDYFTFQYCSGLTTLTIPNSVTSIGGFAFDGCSKLISIYVQNPNPATIKESTFSNRANATLYVPNGCVAAYQNADYWKEFGQILESGMDVELDYDINGDGREDIDDVTSIIRHISGQSPDGFNISSADVNGDSKVNIADVISLINILLDMDE